MPPATQQQQDELLIAAIGASAGGVEAFTELIRNLPTNTGMAFVLIQHLDPSHPSLLSELIARQTSMTVKEVKDGLPIEPNCVYVIPPNANMTISGRTLRLAPRESHGLHMTIDRFMRSLAESYGERAIGVVLSGSGTDGTLGVAEIQAQGGLTFAQSEDSAKHDVMPRSAIASGCIDHVLPPREIARELGRISGHIRHSIGLKQHESGLLAATAESTSLDNIFHRLRRVTGVDFTHYRKTTILRRINRRMVVHKLDRIGDYVRHLHSNPGEINSLYQDLLINVTSFFRNPAFFDCLKTTVFPKLRKHRSSGAALRIWTPGCASGEETYSTAIALLECLGDDSPEVPVQLFGTDVSETSVAKARSGIYAPNIEADVSAERLRRFFTKIEGGYRISKHIRDMCIFAAHNVIDDPPFSQMDLVCCRNLLIYLEPVLQNKVISLFHYALRPGGYLALGSSEGIGSAGALFVVEDRAHKIFSRKAVVSRQLVTFSLNRHAEQSTGPSRRAIQQESSWNYMDAQKEFDRRLIFQYAPAAAFVNDDLEVIHTRGDVGRYLKLPAGRASLSLLKMVREGLFLELRNAIARVKKEGKPVRRENIRMKSGNGNPGRPASSQFVNFEVSPVSVGKPPVNYFMLILDDAPAEVAPKAVSRGHSVQAADDEARAVKLEQELAATKEYLQSVIETHEATNEELQSANEEVLSSNEELQSTNEELETAKEELQSANEELSTVNDELRNRNAEVNQMNNDLTALLGSIDMAVIMVSKDLAIRRFTTRAQEFFGLIPADVGRPLANISPLIEIPDFHALVLQVVGDGRAVEKRVLAQDHMPFMLRILPYRTAENTTEGAVVTFAGLSLPNRPS